MPREPGRWSRVAPLAGSLSVHALLALLGAGLVGRALEPGEALHQVPLSFEVLWTGGPAVEPRALVASSASPHRTVPSPVVAPGGPDHPARPDLERAGRGGTPTREVPALNLASSEDGVTLERDRRSHLDRLQVQRLRTAEERRSPDDRRATPDPMELIFVASGGGQRALRARPARDDAASGLPQAHTAARRGGAPGGSIESLRGEGPGGPAGQAEPGAERASNRRGEPAPFDGRSPSFGARVMHARPDVPRARAAVPSERRGRIDDVMDSEQAVASAVAALVQASTAGGRPGAGPGGDGGGGIPGHGGSSGPGSRASAQGTGGGGTEPARDPRAVLWFRRLERAIDWRRAFPDWAIAEGHTGMLILAFTVEADGRATALQVVRPSGIAEFDRNVARIVSRTRLPPPPAVLGPSVRLAMRFDALNPAVGRDGGGPGGRSARHLARSETSP